MSRRLLQRGRYPKGSGVDQFPNTNTQFPQTTLAQQCPVTSEVPYYNPVQSQPCQNVWNHPSYPNPSTYQQNQVPPPVSEPNSYWSSGQIYPVQAQQPNDPWNWPTENSSENSFANYQQQPQQQPNYQQPHFQQQQQPNYVVEQHNYQQKLQQPNYQQQPVVPPADIWQQNPHSQVENQNFAPQSVVYDSSAQQEQEKPVVEPFQSVNNNSNDTSLDTSLLSWENGSLNITQPAQLPWTYSAPQYCNPAPNLSTNFPSSSVSSNVSWSYNTLTASQSEISNQPSSDHESNNGVKNGAVNLESNTLQNFHVSESQDNIVSNCVPSCENVNSDKNLVIDTEYDTSSLSAFFQNSNQDNSTNSECGETSTPEVKNIIDTASIEEAISHLQINESENSIATEDEQDNHNLDYLEDTDDGGNQEVNFIQEENHVEILSVSGSSVAFVEEPGNQEVPEPNIHLQSQSNQDYHEMSPEEPLNQQIPAESGEKSRSTSSERERVVIRPREESPFKPPRVNSSSKGTVVQQEISLQSVKENKHTKEKTVVQEVNLETFPDNLERPPDYEELKKQSIFYASHQKHLRTELNSSPSSLLCDNPDIPCVTLAPAAPPIHSSSKSDKSESSSDSRREMASFDTSANLRNIAKEPNNVSPAGTDSEFTEQSSIVNNSNSLKGVTERKPMPPVNNKVYPLSLSTQDLSNQHNNQQPSNLFLKESKIQDVRNPEHYRKPTSNMENLQNTSISQGYNSAPPSDYSLSKNKSIDTRYPPEYSRQRFPDQKYASFDDHEYYSDREPSRPHSRSSFDDRSEGYRYPPKRRDYYPPEDDRRRERTDYARPPSRMSESDLHRPERHSQYDYYKQQYPYNGPYQRNQDYYRRPPNYRGYDYDQYQRDPYYASYYDAYRYAYSNYNYGFYDELYRNDPRYQQYREEYRQYYAKYGYDGEYDRSSAHSGRSSANDLTKDMNSVQYLEHDIDSNASEISAYNIQQDYSYDDVPHSVSADHSSTPSQRLTPVKFTYPHTIACFSAGGLLITAVPSQINSTLAAPVKIQTMQMIMENEESYEELKNYQGPLIRGLTHKKDVVEFCNQKIKVLQQKEDVVDRDSYILLWELMILLLRQNGSVAGSDIAELLLKDHEVLRPHAVPLRHNIETPQGEHSPAEVNDSSSQSHAGDTSSPDEGIVVLHDKTSLNVPKPVDVDKVTQKFREFLLFGHKKDALEWAMKHGLWGHALFLASKMDLRTYANVMTRFANSLALNDPLQTLYQLMSGRQPSAVTCVADKKWGDWRPHLAMILSNPSNLPDVDSRSITTLGDTLASRGCLPAAQFCYIMAQVEFGTFEQKNSKLVLLSADHRLSFEEFATNEAIQCTEIYEYAQALANPGYLLIHLQMYKFLYALQLVEHGFLEEALHYCEVIAGNLQKHTNLFSYELVSEVFKLASRLKYHDPHFLRGQGEFEDQDDPEWLKNLEILTLNYYNIMQGQNSEVQYEQQHEPAQTVNELTSPVNENIVYQNIPTPGMQTEITNSISNSAFYQQNWNQQNTTLPNTANLLNNQQEEQFSYYQNDIINNQNSFHLDSNLPSHEENETTDVPSSPVTQTPPFDYYSGSTQQVSDSKQSSYDQLNSYNTSTTKRERRDSNLSSGSRYSTSNLSIPRKQSVKETTKTETKSEAKPSSQAGKTWLGGIFSRLLPKAPNQMILPDDKNPTIVWDEVQKRWVNKDSNDDDETNTPLAPPTDMELMGSKSSDKPTVPLGGSMPPAATSPVNKFQRPKTRGMRQNYVDILNNSGATTKTNVPPEALFPSPLEQTATTSNMFIPPAVSNAGENSSELDATNPSFSNSSVEQQEQSQAMSLAPLMFDPAEFESRRANISNQRHMIGRTGRRTYPT